ncbi:MAG: ferritin family protein [Solirubrobacterales bacterium]
MRQGRCPSYIQPDFPGTVPGLEEAMRGESGAIVFYSYLIDMAPDERQRRVLMSIRSDEERHLNNFQAVYCQYTGSTYRVPTPDVRPPETYLDGLERAFQDEQEAYEFYKANYEGNRNPRIKQAFFDAMLDEAEHARWFNNIILLTHHQHMP